VNLMSRIENIAARIIGKWLRKGNMARCMRDILPHSGLNFEEREKVAEIVHDVVRFKRYYDYVLEKKGLSKIPENYVAISREKPEVEAPRDIRISMSKELASITPDEFVPIINREPKTTLCINLKRLTREDAMEKLKKEGHSAREYIPESAVIASSGARYSSLIKEGYAIVQDASSQIVAKLTSSLGKNILDYCAGSGGKSLAMHSLSLGRSLYAYDANRKKLESLKRRAEIWGAPIHIFWDKPQGLFDVVLVDAPCSGVGAAARNPEAKYQHDFEKFAKIQMRILGDAKKYVSKNGYLVYVVCTYTPMETEDVVEVFLKENENYKMHEAECEYSSYLKMGRYGAYITAGDIFYFSILERVE